MASFPSSSKMIRDNIYPDCTMNFYQSAAIWLEKDSLPKTAKLAKPQKLKKITSGAVITVKDAFYRGSTFSGSFLLAEDVAKIEKTKRRVKIYCCWFGHRLKRDTPSFLIDLRTASITNGGDVFTDLGF